MRGCAKILSSFGYIHFMDSTTHSSNSSNGWNGNTSIPPLSSTPSSEEKKQISPAKHWCLTWNNYPDNWLEKFQSSKIYKYVLGREVGESGTPHIQGYVCFVKKCRPLEVIPLKEIHWGVCRNIEASISYCQKDGDFELKRITVNPILKILAIDAMYCWQRAVANMASLEPDDRDIKWFWENEGNVGKSALVKYLCHTNEAIICSGKASDMKYLIAKYILNRETPPKLVIFDVPRSNLQYISYTGIEEIKNGCFASTKYDCEMILMNSPHIFVFANEPPETHRMSKDRWCVYKIEDHQLVPDDTSNSDESNVTHVTTDNIIDDSEEDFLDF